MEDRGELDLPIVGVARSDWTDDIFRKEATSAIEAAVEKVKKTVLKRLQRRLDLVQGDYAAPTTWAALTDVLNKHKSRTAVYYMAIPPTMFPSWPNRWRLWGSTNAAGSSSRSRSGVTCARPTSSTSCSTRCSPSSTSSASTTTSARSRSRTSSCSVSRTRCSSRCGIGVTCAACRSRCRRRFGVEGRGSFYDSVGAIRDVFQNHLLQVVALLAMEPPVGHEASYLQDEKVKVFAAMTPLDLHHAGPRPVRGLPRRGRRRQAIEG